MDFGLLETLANRGGEEGEPTEQKQALWPGPGCLAPSFTRMGTSRKKLLDGDLFGSFRTTNENIHIT